MLRPFEDGRDWWKGMNVKTFFDNADLPWDIGEVFLRFHQPTDPVRTIVPYMEQFLLTLFGELSLRPKLRKLLSRCTEDYLIHGFMEIHRLSEPAAELAAAEREGRLSPMLEKLFDPPFQPSVNSKLAQAAFDGIERTTQGHIYPSFTVYEEIIEKYEEYREYPDCYIAPYICCIGPSGIGKSFSVKQLAEKHQVPVFYLNLQVSATGFPKKSTFLPPAGEDNVDTHEKNWTRFLSFCLQVLEACERQGISTGGLFQLLTRDVYSTFGKELSDVFKRTTGRKKALGAIMSEYARNLAKENKDITLPWIEKGTPAVICVDGARELLAQGVNQFDAFRLAARRVFSSLADGKRKFFILLVDTTAEISDLPPPQPDSEISGEPTEAIRQLSAWEVFGHGPGSVPDGTAKGVRGLFAVGRPLWGAYLAAGISIDDLISMAEGMLRRHWSASKKPQRLALLCMRADQYVTRRSLGETMASEYLRYAVPIMPCDAKLMTLQPGEPLLAYVASRMLMKLRTRYKALQVWEACLASGSVTTADVGEQIIILILMFAFDDEFHPELHLPEPISLKRFWASAFGKENASMLPDDGGLGSVMLFFNHFVRVSEPPSPITIEASFCRGAALLTSDISASINALIPFRNSMGLGAILIRVETRPECKLTSKLKRSLRVSMKEEIRRLDLERSLPGGYLGIAFYPRCAPVSIKYEFSPTQFVADMTSPSAFPIAYVLGLDPFKRDDNWDTTKMIRGLRKMLNTWPSMHPEWALDVDERHLVYPLSNIKAEGQQEAIEP